MLRVVVFMGFPCYIARAFERAMLEFRGKPEACVVLLMFPSWGACSETSWPKGYMGNQIALLNLQQRRTVHGYIIVLPLN